MRFYCINAETENRGDFLVRLAFGDHLQHFALSAGQQIDRIRYVLSIVAKNCVGDGGTEVTITFRDGAHSGQEVTLLGVFEQITAGSGSENFADIDGIAM